MLDPYHDNKLELISGGSVVTENALAAEILKSDAFSVVNLEDYIMKLQESSGLNFHKLIKFISLSPFFNEGEKHQHLKKILSTVLCKSNLDTWRPRFEKEIESLTQALKLSNDVDLISYSFDIAEKLLRPMILGIETALPNDFERRIYEFQKIAEPMLPLRQLIQLEGELDYLISCLDQAINQTSNFTQNSLWSILKSELGREFSKDDKLMLLIVVYGVKSPLIQTLGNIFSDILLNHREDYFTSNQFDEEHFVNNLDKLINNSASLLHLHRVATREFKQGDSLFKEGDYVLLRTRCPASGHCGYYSKSLGFGLRTHYCSGALVAKTIISIVIPSFFRHYPDVTVRTLESDTTIHTAKALTTLKVNLK